MLSTCYASSMQPTKAICNTLLYRSGFFCVAGPVKYGTSAAPPNGRMGFTAPQGSFRTPSAASSAPYAQCKQLKPLHDPLAPDAYVLDEPGHGKTGVAVVVDPYLGRHLRPHQVCNLGNVVRRHSYKAVMQDYECLHFCFQHS